MDSKTNDALRESIPYVSRPNLLLITSGVDALGLEAITEIFQKVRDFNSFNEDNDPYAEHDFGAFDYKSKKIFWKIDDFRGTEGYDLVLTILLADEY